MVYIDVDDRRWRPLPDVLVKSFSNRLKMRVTSCDSFVTDPNLKYVHDSMAQNRIFLH